MTTVIHNREGSTGRETWRGTFLLVRLRGQDAAPVCVNTRGPLTPSESARTTELP